MMKQTLIASAVASALLMSAVNASAEETPAAPASPWTMTANVGVVSNYLFRGVSQTHNEPAIQGGFDVAHSSGFYAGTWLSSITWVSDFLGGSTPTEMDFYAGFGGTFAEDFTYDLGAIAYRYPGAAAPNAGLANPNTAEVYAGLGYKWFKVKYSHTVSDHFVGWYSSTGGSTKGSNYIELNGAYDLGNGWGVSGHVGRQKVEDFNGLPGVTDADYTDWNVGVTKALSFGVVGLTYSATDADEGCSGGTISAYCFPNGFGSTSFDNVADDVFVLSFKKTF